MSQSELRSCPKCGRDDDAIEYAVDDLTQKWAVVCLGCVTEGPEADSMSAAADAWNSLPRAKGDAS